MVLTIVILFAMTTAWYTNIVETGNLIFEAEAWGFEGDISIGNDDNIIAAPGDSGMIDLQVENQGDSVSAISMNVSKAGMDRNMQKRLFFYVDTRMTRNGEIMDRVYLNSYEGYTYTLFSKGKLMLTDQISNAPRLKWQWVKDVLGYYVIGQKVERTSEDGSITQDVTVKEYLRPIEYDYDAATMKVDTSGEDISVSIKTVDGKTEPLNYLIAQTFKDGYAGNTLQYAAINGFYPIDVDETGYGVYAYLCSYSDIQIETAFDTRLGQLAYQQANGGELEKEEEALLRQTAVLNISAQTGESTAISVGTLSALETAITQNITDIIQLSSDVTIPADKTLSIPQNTKIMLDLNGHTITSESATGILAYPGSSLTMINGKLKAPDGAQKRYGLYTIGAEAVMSEVTVTGFQYGVYLGDNDPGNELDSRVHLVDCTIDGTTCAVFVSGNGTLSSQKTQVVLEKCTLSSDGFAISGNGDTAGNGRWGTDIQILNSTLTGKYSEDGSIKSTGIYHPQKDSTLTVYHSDVSGFTGIAVKGGTVSIVDSDIQGNGTDPVIVEPGKFANSGFLDTGDAVYIETNYGYETIVNVSGDSKLISSNGESLRVHDVNATNVTVKVESGTFKPALSSPDYLAEGVIQTGPGPNDDFYHVTSGG